MAFHSMELQAKQEERSIHHAQLGGVIFEFNEPWLGDCIFKVQAIRFSDLILFLNFSLSTLVQDVFCILILFAIEDSSLR